VAALAPGGGVIFSVAFVSIVCVSLVMTESGVKVVLFVIFFENGDEVIKVEVLVPVVILIVIIEYPVTDNVIEGTGWS
jgi:hypothetical protein